MFHQTACRHGDVCHGGEFEKQVVRAAEYLRHDAEHVRSAFLEKKYFASVSGASCGIHEDDIGGKYPQPVPQPGFFRGCSESGHFNVVPAKDIEIVSCGIGSFRIHFIV